MDRNTIIGLVLIVGMVLTYAIFMGDQEPPQQNNPSEQSETLVDTGFTNVIEPGNEKSLFSTKESKFRILSVILLMLPEELLNSVLSRLQLKAKAKPSAFPQKCLTLT